MKFDLTRFKLDVKSINMSQTDRLVRVIVAALLIIGTIRGGSWIAGLIGLALIATAWYRYCPGYALAKFTTIKDKTPPATGV